MSSLVKRILASLALGIVLTFAVGGLKYLLLDRPGFHPLQGCHNDPLCDPSPYLAIGIPWRFGYFSDASGNVVVLGFNQEDLELTPRHYNGFLADVALYGVLAFVALSPWPKLRRASAPKKEP